MNGFAQSRGGQGPGGMTSLVGNLSNVSTSTLITLTAPSNQIKITNYDTTNRLFVNFNGAATASNYGVAPGTTLTYDGPAISSFQLFSNSQSINYGIFAY